MNQHLNSDPLALAYTPMDDACRSGANRLQIGDEVRWVAGFQELDCPSVPFPSRRIFALAGEPTLRALVRRHHQRLKNSQISGLFPTNLERFLAGVERSADYVVEACGGPAHFTASQGKACMRKRHFPFTIDENAREVWLGQLWLAFDDVGFPREIRQEYWDWVEAFSIRMINRRTQRDQPRRYPFHEVAVALLPRLDAACPAAMATSA